MDPRIPVIHSKHPKNPVPINATSKGPVVNNPSSLLVPATNPLFNSYRVKSLQKPLGEKTLLSPYCRNTNNNSVDYTSVIGKPLNRPTTRSHLDSEREPAVAREKSQQALYETSQDQSDVDYPDWDVSDDEESFFEEKACTKAPSVRLNSQNPPFGLPITTTTTTSVTASSQPTASEMPLQLNASNSAEAFDDIDVTTLDLHQLSKEVMLYKDQELYEHIISRIEQGAFKKVERLIVSEAFQNAVVLYLLLGNFPNLKSFISQGASIDSWVATSLTDHCTSLTEIKIYYVRKSLKDEQDPDRYVQQMRQSLIHSPDSFYHPSNNNGNQLTEIQFNQIRKKCIDLEHLSIDDCSLIDFSELKKFDPTLSKLKFLSLCNCSNMGNKALEVILKNNPSLETLQLYECYNKNLTGLPIATLGSLKHLTLTCLGSHYSPISSAAFLRIAQNCRQLESINILNCINIDDNAVNAIGNYCKNLKHFRVTGLNRITRKGVETLCKQCRQLESIHCMVEVFKK